MKAYRTLVVLLVLVLGSGRCLPARAEDVIAGVILSIKGPARLVRAGSKARIDLHPAKDVHRFLVDGDSISAEPGGAVRIRLINDETKTLSSADGAFVVRTEKSLTKAQTDFLNALREYGTPGGSRGSGSPVWSVPEGTAIRGDHIRIAWHMPGQTGSIAFSVAFDSGEIWSVTNVDPKRGRLAPAQEAGLRQALGNRRSTVDVQPMVLTVASRDRQMKTQFMLLSGEEERHVREQLSAWDNEPEPVLKAIGRASVFTRMTLFAEALDEYDTALSHAPESDPLLQAAIAAHQQVGNTARVRELESRRRPAR